MLILPSSGPSGALVKIRVRNQRFGTSVSEPADVRVSDTEIVVKLAETADKSPTL